MLVVGQEFSDLTDEVDVGAETVVVVGGHAPQLGFDEWLGAHEPREPALSPAGGDVALQLYTSGTTGMPKGAMLTHDNLWRMHTAIVDEWRLDASSVSLCALPLFHIAGLIQVVAPMIAGCPTILHREFRPAAFLDALGRHRVTHTALVPAMLQSVLAAPELRDADTSSLRVMAYGAAPISEDVLARAVSAFGCDFFGVYGLTEITGPAVLLRPGDHRLDGPHRGRLRSAGTPLGGIEVRIVDPGTGRDAAVGEVGEVWLRGPTVMAGYWNRPKETAAVITTDGWLRSGDAGYLDEDGYLYIHDRIKDMIVTGGENVYPAEVENALMSHAGVADAAVIGVPDERWGEAVKAVVVRAPGSHVTDVELIEACRQRLARFKCPTSVVFVDALPRNPSGKVLKREVRAPYWRNRERHVG